MIVSANINMIGVGKPIHKWFVSHFPQILDFNIDYSCFLLLWLFKEIEDSLLFEC